MIERRTHDRTTVGELLDGLDHWPHPERVASALHQGDLGWQLRLRPCRGEVLFGKTDQLLKSRGILDGHIG